MLIGLIFRASAKSKRSLTSWREHGKSVLPNHIAGSFKGDADAESVNSTSKAGYGFGRQGEKAAGLKGGCPRNPNVAGTGWLIFYLQGI